MSAFYCFGQIKIRNGKKQAAKEGFVLGVVYGVNGQYLTVLYLTNSNEQK